MVTTIMVVGWCFVWKSSFRLLIKRSHWVRLIVLVYRLPLLIREESIIFSSSKSPSLLEWHIDSNTLWRTSWPATRYKEVKCQSHIDRTFIPSISDPDCQWSRLHNPGSIWRHTHTCSHWAATGQSMVMLTTAAPPINSFNLRHHTILHNVIYMEHIDVQKYCIQI